MRVSKSKHAKIPVCLDSKSKRWRVPAYLDSKSKRWRVPACLDSGKNKHNKSLYLLRKNIILYKKKIRFILSISFTLLIIISICFISKTIYVKVKCKDLNYAVNYELSNSDSSEVKLLRVKTSKLLFYNNTKAVVKAYGLSKNEPHKQTVLEAHFEKNILNSWKLDDAYNITCN